MPSSVTVHPNRFGLFRLRFVDRCVGGGVDDDIWARRCEPCKNRSAVGQVKDRPAERDDFSLETGALKQRRRHLALRSGDRDPHHSNSSGASLSRGKRRSLSESTGPPASDGQATPIAGSSQATPRSWAAE